MGNFISHTVSAKVMLPLVATLATGLSGSMGDAFVMASVLQVALICSLGMALPISTPPNAMAYATGQLETRDFLITGGVVSLGGAALVIAGTILFS
jgi:sodium-dependent dicarboxylate transporter 2/3/5